MEKKYGRANKLSGLNKALAAGATEITKEEYFLEKTVHTQVHNKILVHLDTTAQPEPVKVADEVKQNYAGSQYQPPDAVSCSLHHVVNLLQGISDPNDLKWIKGSRPAIL